MSDPATWQLENGRFLSAALASLRARLEPRAGEEPASTALARPQPAAGPRTSWRQLVRRGPQEDAGAGGALMPAPAITPGGRIELASGDLAAIAAQMDPPPALIALSRTFGLSPFEQEILLLCVAMELDTGIAGLCARAQNDPTRPYPTFALALSLFDEPAWDALSPERPLRFWRLIDITQQGAQPLTTSALRADECIVNCVKGLNYLDDRLAPLLTPLELAEPDGDLPASHREVVDRIVQRLTQGGPAAGLPVVQLLGSDAATKRLVAARVGGAIGLRGYRLPSELLPTAVGELETLARLCQREGLRLPIALYVDTRGTDGEGSRAAHVAVSRLLERAGGVIFLDTRDVWPGLTRPTVFVDVAKPTAAEQRAVWAASLASGAGDEPARLAAQFDLDLPSLRAIAHTVSSDPAADGRPLHERLWDACLESTRSRMDTLARRLTPKATWDDIVLPPAETALLRQIAAQVGRRGIVYEQWGFRDTMSRGLGISVLFAGESGTGKTMAAEVIANDLRLSLYRIDLSAVVSKYIGETEKNLRELFDRGEDGGAILFFDEADALFGKRSEVKDSHDRYANIEINYLLQRMEAYRGLAILATNMKSALDTAFLRRLRFILTFPFPGVAQRKAIWQKVFPARTPTQGLDFDRLARVNMTGGLILTVALNAAFLAAHAGTPVTMPLILDAARTEFRMLDRPTNDAAFHWPASAGAVA